MSRAVFFAAVMLTIAGCGSGDSYQILVEPHGQKILIGRISPSLLDSDSSFQWYRQNYASFTPDSASIVFLSSAARNIHFIVFGGTWCGDTKRDLPKFFKTMSLAHIPEANIELYGVDRLKKSSDGLAEKYHLTNVPTFIVLTDGKEIGRIVEEPTVGIEFDLVQLLQKK
ncbi:MAG: thioredoxin family protein [Bacteroidota bacterium]